MRMTPDVLNIRHSRIHQWAEVGAFVGLCLLLIAGISAAPVTAQSGPTPQFVVAVHEDGSATVSVTYTFDLTSESARGAFRSLRTDREARADARARFVSRMRATANRTENVTGRSMSVTDSSIDLSTTADNSTGIVTLSVDWQGLAAQRDGTLVITEPFASMPSPDRRFVLKAPDGHRITQVSPSPRTKNATAAVWAPSDSLEGFKVVITTPTQTPTISPTATQTQQTTVESGQPGFGVVVGLLALLVGGFRWRVRIE